MNTDERNLRWSFSGSPPPLREIEVALAPMATTVSPPGTELAAVAHQWAFALVEDSALFGGVPRESIESLLRAKRLLDTKAQLAASLTSARSVQPKGDKFFEFIDLFAGIGGMRIGFQNVGGRCVFSSEFDKCAQATYAVNHGEQPFGDITKIEAAAIPDHDVLLAGFPCQPFSHAGLKLGIEDTRGTLFYNIAQILRVKQPKFALLENVRGLISHQRGRTLQVILEALTEIGYKCNIPREMIRSGTTEQIQAAAKRMVLRSADFGVPQNRQRIYIVLWRGGMTESFAYPKPTGATTRVGDILEPNPEAKFRLSDRLWSGHQRRKVENAEKGKGFGFGLVTPESRYANTISARYYKDGSEVLVEDIKGRNPRKLTPREAARLQGFPESFVIHPSTVQAYRQFGNSVSIPVIEAIGRQIRSLIEAKESHAG